MLYLIGLLVTSDETHDSASVVTSRLDNLVHGDSIGCLPLVQALVHL